MTDFELNLERISRDIQRKIDDMAQPGMWQRYTKNMECGEYREFKQYYNDLETILDALKVAIAALSEQPQWISVKDALPVINDNEPLEEFVTDRGYTFFVSDGKYVWTELFLLKANKFDDESVTHWMPLPLVPPKEEV